MKIEEDPTNCVASAYVVFDSRTGAWLLSAGASLFAIDNSKSAQLAAQSFPMAVLEQDDDAPFVCGQASFLSSSEGLDIVLRREGTEEQVVKISNTPPSAPAFVLKRGRSTQGTWAFPKTDWIFSIARLECQNAAGVKFTYYLPERNETTKELVAVVSGERHVVSLHRGMIGTFEIRFSSPQTQQIELITNSERDASDQRPLGFVLVDFEFLPLDKPHVENAEGNHIWANLTQALKQISSNTTNTSKPYGGLIAFERRQARTKGRPRAAIVCWDFAHNPAGRAAVLYRLLESDWDCTLVGPVWSRFGQGLWGPLRDEGFQHHLFRVGNLRELWVEASAAALEGAYDLVVMCKPRLPGMITAFLLAEQSTAPLVIDIDESEESFQVFDGDGDDLQAEPFIGAGTALSHQFLHLAGAITVSNPSLKKKHHGYLVRHARDETTALPNRQTARHRLGFDDDDFVIAFVGTVRPHKGLKNLLAAVEEINDPGIRLLVVGTPSDPEFEALLDRQPARRVIRRPNCRFSQVGEYLAAADLVPILQDPDSLVSQTQLPAKLVDALQFGLPVIATDVPPLRDLAMQGVVRLVAKDLAQTLRSFRRSGVDEAARMRARLLFEEEFGLEVNRARLNAAIRAACDKQEQNAPGITQALVAVRQKTSPGAGKDPRPVNRGRPDEVYDIAMFWKQNDSGLYGRRSDMVVKYLLESGRVRHIVHFDHSAAMDKLRDMSRSRVAEPTTSKALEFPNTVSRHLGLADTAGLSRRIILTPGNDHAGRTFGGIALTDKSAFVGAVQQQIEDAGLRPETTLAWCFPVVWGFSELVRAVKFRGIVVDLMDDQRAWPIGADFRQRLDDEYRATLQSADLVFTNCQGNKDLFSAYRSDITVIPNGAELQFIGDRVEANVELQNMTPPIIGYTGNMTARFDWALVDVLTGDHPEWQFVFIGAYNPAHVPTNIVERVNVHFMGPVPYSELPRYLQSFSVAILPHVVSHLSESMNPLKIYNYLAAGIPVVSTAVANLKDVEGMIEICHTPQAFAAAIEALVAAGPAGTGVSKSREPAWQSRLAEFDWQKRIETMLDRMDATFGKASLG